jgi:hypothetical protein
MSPRTRRPKNYLRLRVLTSYFYVCFHATIAGGPYFLLLLLRSFPRSNYQRSLLLIITFMFVSAQQLSSSMGEVFLGFGGWVRIFGCAFFGLRDLGGSCFLFFSWRGGGGGVLGVLIGGSEPEWEMRRTEWGGSTGCIMHRVHTSYN